VRVVDRCAPVVYDVPDLPPHIGDVSIRDRILTKTGLHPRATTVREWLLLDGHRLVVACLLLVVVLLAVSAVLDGAVTRADTGFVSSLFGAFVAGNLTLLTVVLSISQLVLSRELRTPRELRMEVEGAAEFVEAVEAETRDDVSPRSPSLMLHALLQSIDGQTDDLEAAAETVDSGQASDLESDLGELVETLGDGIHEMDDLLEEPGVGLFSALSTILRHDFSNQLDQARRIRDVHAAALSDSTTETLQELERRLTDLDIARQYTKTIYVQQELSYLSRVLLYVGFPSMVVSVAVLLSMIAPGRPELLMREVLIACVVVSFAPLAVLFAYTLRMATVAERTAAVTPFPSPE